jgi:hypothetical protein
LTGTRKDVNSVDLCYYSNIMKAPRRLIYYLLLNIFVSAIVTGTIIFFYDHARQSACNTNLSNAAVVPPGAQDVNVNLAGVIGAGTITDELIILRNDGNESIILTDWYIKDSKGLTYTFPQLTLYPGGKVQVHSKSGTDKLPDLFWGRTASVWTSGELAALYDSKNIARAFYRVP